MSAVGAAEGLSESNAMRPSILAPAVADALDQAPEILQSEIAKRKIYEDSGYIVHDVGLSEPSSSVPELSHDALTTSTIFNGHNRRISVASRRSSTSNARRGSVLSSSHEFDEFQEEEDGSDFGDFEDEQQDEVVIDVQSSSLRTLPEISDQEHLAEFLHGIINDIFPLPEPGLHVKRINAIPIETEDDFEEESPFMLTDRAISLWKQLTAAPPLQPPAWKHSRVRRLFLVSLGIPLDLDEILPKMMHKKLVLPSTKKRDKSTTTRRRKIPPPPEFELHLARQLCQTTEAALNNMDDREKTIRIATLKAHTLAASNLLTYWLEQRELAQTDKETLEAVVENLVKFHRRQMDEQVKKQASTVKKNRFSFMPGS